VRVSNTTVANHLESRFTCRARHLQLYSYRHFPVVLNRKPLLRSVAFANGLRALVCGGLLCDLFKVGIWRKFGTNFDRLTVLQETRQTTRLQTFPDFSVLRLVRSREYKRIHPPPTIRSCCQHPELRSEQT